MFMAVELAGGARGFYTYEDMGLTLARVCRGRTSCLNGCLITATLGQPRKPPCDLQQVHNNFILVFFSTLPNNPGPVATILHMTYFQERMLTRCQGFVRTY